jgi:hypothetical protein
MYGMMGGMGMGGMGMGMGMGGMGMMGGGMGMMGGGMGMGGGQAAPPAEPPPKSDLREDEIETAIKFVERPDVRNQNPDQIKAYLKQQMGLSGAELVQVMHRSGMEEAGVVYDETDSDSEEDIDRYVPVRRESAPPSIQGRALAPPTAAGMLQGNIPAPVAYSAAAAALMIPDHRSFWDRVTGKAAASQQAREMMHGQLLQQMQRTNVLEQAGGELVSNLPPSLILNRAPDAAGLAWPVSRMRRMQWFLVAGCCAAAGYYGCSVLWRRVGPPLLRRVIALVGPLDPQIDNRSAPTAVAGDAERDGLARREPRDKVAPQGKIHGLTQILGQLQASNREFQSNCWADL